MTDRKFIMVVGMPRGGTSLVSKMLIELGVNMGERLVDSNFYPNYEDADFQKAIGNWSMMNPMSLRKRSLDGVRAYIEKRLREVDGPVGAKFPCVSNLYGVPGWKDLPIQVVHVRRDLQEVIESDLKNYTGRNRDELGRIKRAGELGQIWYAQQRFLEHYKPAVLLEHNEDAHIKVDFLHWVLMGGMYSGDPLQPAEVNAIVDRCIKDPDAWRVKA